STPLMLAAHRGHVDTVRYLVESGGADPEAVDKFGRTPLHLACMQGHFNVVYYLLAQGVDADSEDSSSNRPSHYAAAFGFLPVLRLLVVMGKVDLSAVNVWHTSPLSIANLKGHFSVVKYIL
ncbi:ankyrin repeat protein, partial [Halteromyces radiatus]|uniref:ankyrin repeat protein n=1 Tax=Halteromyces radiatus TaxID=101107 RepID=UPI00221FE6F8